MKNKLKQKLEFSCVQKGTWSDVAGYVRHQLRALLGARQAAAIQIHALPHASAEWKGPSATKYKLYSFARVVSISVKSCSLKMVGPLLAKCPAKEAAGDLVASSWLSLHVSNLA